MNATRDFLLSECGGPQHDELVEVFWVAMAAPRLDFSVEATNVFGRLAHHFARHRRHPASPPHFHLTPIKEIHYTMADLQVHDDQAPFTAHLILLDAAQQPTVPDDIPTWNSSADNVATVSSTTVDGTSATIAIPGGIGVAEIVATTVDADGTKIVLSGTIEVIAGEAKTGSIQFDLTGSASPAPVEPTPDPTPVDNTGDPTATAPSTGDSTGDSTGTDAPQGDTGTSPDQGATPTPDAPPAAPSDPGASQES